MTEPADPLEPPGTTDSSDAVSDMIPRLYIASPLTGLNDARREAMSHRIETVKQSVFDATVGNRAPADSWPVTLHVPWDHTPPWIGDGLSPSTVYDRNLEEMLQADGLIVVADEFCSAGIGQELEWAARIGIPALYVSRAEVSRQIRGIPHAISVRTCVDAETMAGHVRTWLANHQAQLKDGPRRRADRYLAYIKLTAQLEVAWTQTFDKSSVAAQLGLQPNAIDSMIKSPARVALTPWWTICELATELGVSLDVRRALTFIESRAWAAAAQDGQWDPQVAERVRAYALSGAFDELELPGQWASIHSRMFGGRSEHR